MAAPELHRPFVIFLVGMGLLVLLSFALFGMASALIGEILVLFTDYA